MRNLVKQVVLIVSLTLSTQSDILGLSVGRGGGVGVVINRGCGKARRARVA